MRCTNYFEDDADIERWYWSGC